MSSFEGCLLMALATSQPYIHTSLFYSPNLHDDTMILSVIVRAVRLADSFSWKVSARVYFSARRVLLLCLLWETAVPLY